MCREGIGSAISQGVGKLVFIVIISLAMTEGIEHVNDFPFSSCELFHFERLRVACHAAAVFAYSAEIQMVVSVGAALHNELGVVPRQEDDRV